VFLSVSGVTTLKEACAPYGEPIIFLFLGGFILALSLEKWRIHERVALYILSLTGTSANGVIFGFMSATALLSMWMSNTATTLMMLPIALSVLGLLLQGARQESSLSEAQERGIDRFGVAMMLAVAYGANIGGSMTLIGTPPNLKLAEEINRGFPVEEAPLTFLGWLKIGVPFGIVTLIFTFLLLVWVLYPNRLGKIEGASTVIDKARSSLGPWNHGQRLVSVVFGCTALGWVFRKQIVELTGLSQLSDVTIGLIGATVLFMIPSFEDTTSMSTEDQSISTSKDETRARLKPLLVWEDMRRLPWDIVLLFGGGLSLASALNRVGLIQAIGDLFSNLGSMTAVSLAILTLIALLLTEVMSNVALVIVLLPVMTGVAKGLGLDPITLCAPVTMAASCAFMLPMSTPPNAIVFASGHVRIGHMVKAGLVLNLVVVLWITTLVRWFYF
jgi:sodium-dependent dicarboxylate transporter 2/3/5